MAPLISMPDTPHTTTDVVSASVKFPDSQPPNADQSPLSIVKFGSSVVINVPSSLFEERSDEEDNRQEFKTKDFFNAAEQEIEKVFIHSGFRVLSRAKFEAKLRDLRDESRCDTNRWECLRSQVSPEAQAILDELKSKFDHKEISAADYAEQIKQFKDKLQTSSAGKSRKGDDKELTDISEVIRAAQSGDTRADYILQINKFDTKKEIQFTKDIRQIAEIREFSRKYPGIENQLQNSTYNQLSCKVLGAELNAKLINVKSGEIIWIGSYELNEFSSGVNQLQIELGERTYPTNEASISDFVHYQNTEFQRSNRRDNQSISIPEWNFKTDLVPVTVVSGRCEKRVQYSHDVGSQLSRDVAKGLIGTIKVTGEQQISDQQIDDPKSNVPKSPDVQINTQKKSGPNTDRSKSTS
jgi:hypothetical protein